MHLSAGGSRGLLGARMDEAEAELAAEPSVARLVEAALAEDIGRADVTTHALVPPGTRARGKIVAREALVLAGGFLLAPLFARLGRVEVQRLRGDGEEAAAGEVVAELAGEARAILTGERTALNFLQHLSGIATLTRRTVRALEGSACRVRDTRKTVPGMRLLAKYAVRVGGGTNHRVRLDERVLVKDNHLALVGSITEAVARVRAGAPGMPVEVECRTLGDVEEALAAGADEILLDNMDRRALEAAVRLVGGRVPIEASGGIRPDDAAAIAALGVTFVSIGALTHSAPAVDLSLDLEPC